MALDITFIVQSIFFLVTLGGLAQLLFRPMLTVFNEREARTSGAAEETASMQASSTQMVEKADKALAEAQAKAREVLLTLREEGADKQKKIIDDARDAAQAKLEAARKELADKTEAATKALDVESKKLADDIVNKVLGRAA